MSYGDRDEVFLVSYLPNKTHLVFICLSIRNWLIKLQCGRFHRRARMEGVRAFILSLKRESHNKAYTESPTKNIRNLPSTYQEIYVIGKQNCKPRRLWFNFFNLLRYVLQMKAGKGWCFRQPGIKNCPEVLHFTPRTLRFPA